MKNFRLQLSILFALACGLALWAQPTPLNGGAGAGTVTAVSIATANGFSGTSSGGATPALTIVAGAIAPTSVNGNTFTAGSSTYTGTAGQTYTFPTTTATIARTDAANTFTGVQSMTSPAITTSLTSPSATFALLNVTPTTINAFGAATTINMGNSAGTTNLLGTLALNPGGSVAGGYQMGQGTLPALGTTAATWSGPTSITSHNVVVPGAVGSTGMLSWTVSGTTATIAPVTTLVSGLTVPAPIFSTGFTASGSSANTLAGSSGTFITSTGLNTLSGATTLAPAARATGIASYWTVTTPADTNMTASTESIGANWAAATRQWATGALTTQREHVYAAPTYGFVGASTLTTAVNVDIADPIAGTNATLTNKYGLRVNNQQVTGTLTANTGTNLFGPFVDSVDGTTPLNNINQVVATGTAYTMTNAYGSLDFGTTDPILTIANAGTYAVFVDVQLNLVGATYATYDSATIKLRRTNNTAADLTGSTFGTFIPTITTITAVGPYLHVGPIKYQTTNTNDTITVQGILGTTPAAGSVTATACTITAIRAY